VAGIPDDVFWESTITEIVALLEKIGEREEARERNAALRAGLIASEIYNANRVDSRGRSIAYRGPPRGAGDYVKQPVQNVDGETMRDLVRSWLRQGRN